MSNKQKAKKQRAISLNNKISKHTKKVMVSYSVIENAMKELDTPAEIWAVILPKMSNKTIRYIVQYPDHFKNKMFVKEIGDELVRLAKEVQFERSIGL